MRRVLVLALTACTSAPVPADVHLDIQADGYGDAIAHLHVGADIGPHAAGASMHSEASGTSSCTEREAGDCLVSTCESTWGRDGGGWGSTPPPPVPPPLHAETVTLDWALGPTLALLPTDRGRYAGSSESVPAAGVPMRFMARGGEVLPIEALLPWPGIPAPSALVVERDELIELTWTPPPIAVDGMQIMLSDVRLSGNGTSVRCRVDASLGRTSFPALLASAIDREDAWVGASVSLRQDIALVEGPRLIADVSAGVIWLDAEW